MKVRNEQFKFETYDEYEARTKELARYLFERHSGCTSPEDLEAFDKDLMPNYLEVQIHGPVLLEQHVERLIVDPQDITSETRPWVEKLRGVIFAKDGNYHKLG